MEDNLIKIKGKYLWHIRTYDHIRERDESICGHAPSIGVDGEPTETELGNKRSLGKINLCKHCLAIALDEGIVEINYLPQRHLENVKDGFRERPLTIDEYAKKVRGE